MFGRKTTHVHTINQPNKFCFKSAICIKDKLHVSELSQQPLQQFFCYISMWDSLQSQQQHNGEGIPQGQELLSGCVQGLFCSAEHSSDFVQIRQYAMCF